MTLRALTLLLVPLLLLFTLVSAESKQEGENGRLTRIGDQRFEGGSDYKLARGNFNNTPGEEFVLSMIGANGIPAVLIYEHQAPDKLIRIGDLRFEGSTQVRVAVGNLIGNERDELAVAVMDNDGQNSLQVFEIQANHQEHKVIDLKFTGGKDYQVTTGNFDGDTQEELVLTMLGADGRLSSIIYDIPVVGKAIRIGDLRFEGGNWIRAVAANLDDDSIDELVLAYDQPGNKRRIAVYDHPVNLHQSNITQLDFTGGTAYQLSAANMDWDSRDEVILSMLGSDGRWAVLVHDTDTGNTLERTSDLRFEGGSDLSIATANLDHDPAAELLLSMIDGSGRVTLLAYDALTSRHLRRLDSLRMSGGAHPGVASARLIDGKADQILLTLLGEDGRRAVLAYDYRADMSETKGEIPVLTILWDPHRPDHPAPSRRDIELIMFDNPDFNVAGWFHENSRGKLRLTNAGVYGWLDANEVWQFYWREGDYAPPTEPNDPHYHQEKDGTLRYKDDDGFIGGIAAGWAEAIRKVDTQVDFSSFDHNSDGIIQPEELAILIVKPQNNTRGFQRTLLGSMVPKEEPLVVDGKELTLVAEVYIGGKVNQRENIGIFTEELAHAILSIPDQYFEGPLFGDTSSYSVWNDAGGFSLTTNNPQHVHLEPFQKWRLGWTEPTHIDRNGTYSIRHTGGSSETLLLSNSDRGSREYFLLENRSKDPSSYDLNLPDQGLAVWHVIEDPKIYGNLPSPPGIRMERWDLVKKHDWGRRAVRLLRPTKRIPFSANTLSVDFDGDGMRELLVLPKENGIHSPFLSYDFQENKDTLKQLEAPRFQGGSGLTASAAKLDRDPEEEVVLALEGTDGRIAMLAYDFLKDGTVPQRIGDLRISGAYHPDVAAVNLDLDPESEVLLVRVAANGHILLSTYDPPLKGKFKEIHSIDLGFGGSPLVTAGDLDGDGLSEIIVGWQSPNGEGNFSVYRTTINGLTLINNISFKGVSELQAWMAGLDDIGGDELILGFKDASGRLTVLLYNFSPTSGLIRVGDLRFTGHTQLDLATGNLDDDAEMELAISTLDQNGILYFRLYDLKGWNNLLLADEMTFKGAYDASLALTNLNSSNPDELLVGFRGNDERLTVLVYDLTNPTLLTHSRIGDARYGREFNLSLWDGSDPVTGYDLLSNNPVPDCTELRWADGTPSGFAIRNISAASSTIQMEIQVPDF